MYILGSTMPYEEYYNPADDDNYSTDKNKKGSADYLKDTDKQYQKYTKPLNKTWKDGKYYKKVYIECYGSGQVGTKIRNAVTGQYYTYTVGSDYEDLLFKVIDSSARQGRKDPLILFYDTPEQYENHRFNLLSQKTKELWYDKNMEARQKS